MTQRMELDGKLSILRRTGGGEDDRIVIELIDAGSGISFVAASVCLDVFARAVTGLGHVQCRLTLFGLESVGLIRENKTVEVTFDQPSGDRALAKQQAAAALEPFERDGWRGNADDLLNFNNRLPVSGAAGERPMYRAHLSRLVERRKES